MYAHNSACEEKSLNVCCPIYCCIKVEAKSVVDKRKILQHHLAFLTDEPNG